MNFHEIQFSLFASIWIFSGNKLKMNIFHLHCSIDKTHNPIFTEMKNGEGNNFCSNSISTRFDFKNEIKIFEVPGINYICHSPWFSCLKRLALSLFALFKIPLFYSKLVHFIMKLDIQSILWSKRKKTSCQRLVTRFSNDRRNRKESRGKDEIWRTK